MLDLSRSLVVLGVGFAVTFLPSTCWATEVAAYLKFSEASQTTYVAGVVDTLMQRAMLEILTKNPDAKMSDMKQSPFIRCIMQTSYGTFHSVTRDLLKTTPKEDDLSAALVVVRAVGRLCPP